MKTYRGVDVQIHIFFRRGKGYLKTRRRKSAVNKKRRLLSGSLGLKG
jgi:hypothetical protein